MTIQSLRERALALASKNEMTGAPRTVAVVYVDRTAPSLIISENVEYISKARWYKLSKEGKVLDTIIFNGVKVYRVGV